MTPTQLRLETLHEQDLTDAEHAEVIHLIHAEPDLWRRYGDANDWTRGQILDALLTNEVDSESTLEGINQMRKQLLAEGDSILEVIAVEQIITNHLQVARSGYELEKLTPCHELSAVSRHWAKVHNMASTRLFRAINHLMRIRRNILGTAVKIHQHRNVNFNLTTKEVKAYMDTANNWADLNEQAPKMGPETDKVEVSTEIDEQIDQVSDAGQYPCSAIDHDELLKNLIEN